MIFQDPMTSLNPVHRIGDQIVEQIQAHEDVSDAEARDRVVALLERVGIPRARERFDSYPHEFSGGMRQRVMIAMALSCDPSRADRRRADDGARRDDPGADPRGPAAAAHETNAGIILVTHDLGVVADIADRIAVMYAGRIVEQGTIDEIFYDPRHPYTWGLLGSITRVDRPRPERLPSIPGLPPSLIHPPQGCHFRPALPARARRVPRKPELRARVPGETGPRGPLRDWSPTSKAKLRRGRPDRARGRRGDG